MTGMSSYLVIITGANRRIGHSLVRLFASHPPVTPATIYACARQASSIPPINVESSAIRVRPTSLDVTNRSSIEALAEEIQASHKDGIDVLVNNAGVNYTGNHSADNAKNCVAVNVDGMLNMTLRFGPLMKRSTSPSRIINLSSAASTLRPEPFGSYGAEILTRIRSASEVSELIALRDDYLHAVLSPTSNEAENGWPKHNSYKVSKALVNVLTRVTADDPKIVGDGQHRVAVNCCCPGWVDTEMGSMMGPAPKTPEEGARVPFELARMDLRGVTGEYWALPGVSQRNVDGLRPVNWMNS